MANKYSLKRDPRNGLIYIHWCQQTALGERGRSRRQSTRTTDMDAAQAFLGEWLLMEQEQPARTVFTVAELWALYYERHAKKNVTALDTLIGSWKNLAPQFGALKLPDVSQDVVEQYEDKRARGIIGQPSVSATVRRELNALRACFNWCADPMRKIITRGELPAFLLPKDGEPRDRWLKTEEVATLLDAGRRYSKRRSPTVNRMSRGERFILLALHTAARCEAIRQLEWSRVDWETGVIDFNVPGRKKTKKRRVVVPVSAGLKEPLRRMYEERSDSGYVLDTDSPVVGEVRAIAKLAELSGVSPHVLRHTAATHMARRGVSLWMVAKVLGNTVEMVERVYAKHAPDDLRAAVNTIAPETVGV